MSDNLTIVVGSCDAYADIAELYVKFLRKYWPDCKYPILVVLEQKKINLPGVRVINSNEGEEWVSRIIRALNEVKSKYVLLTVEDLFLCRPVNDGWIREILNIMDKENLLYYEFPVKIHRKKRNEKKFKNYNHIYSIAKNKPYGINMGTAIWEKNELIRILNDGIETAWDIENYFLEKSYANKDSHDCYEYYVCDDGSAIKLAHMIKKGRWIPEGKKEIAHSQVKIDYSKRGFVPLNSRIRSVIVGVGNAVVPVKARPAVKAAFSKIGFKFATKY